MPALDPAAKLQFNFNRQAHGPDDFLLLNKPNRVYHQFIIYSSPSTYGNICTFVPVQNIGVQI